MTLCAEHMFFLSLLFYPVVTYHHTYPFFYLTVQSTQPQSPRQERESVRKCTILPPVLDNFFPSLILFFFS